MEAHGLGTWRDLRDLSLSTDNRAEVTRLIEEDSEAFLLYPTRRRLSLSFVWDVEGAGRSPATAARSRLLVLRGLSAPAGVETIHLFIACPASMALFLGQRLNGLGPLRTTSAPTTVERTCPAWILRRAP